MALRHYSGRGLLAVLVAGVLVAGCNPDPGTTPTATPSTPASGTPSPTPTENAQEREQREAFEAAEKAYRGAFQEISRLAVAGGADEPTRELRNSAAGEYLDAQMDQLKWLKQNDSHLAQAGSIRWVKRAGYWKSQVTLSACEDYRKALIVDPSGKSTEPEGVGTRVYNQQLTIDLIDGRWKVTKLDTEDQLKECSQ